MTLDWMAAQIQSLPSSKLPERFNPRPAGVIQAGSASEAVLELLRTHPQRFFTCGELIRRTNRTHAAVTWACLYLRSQGLVQASSDGARNPRFLRYRIVKE